VADNGNIVLDGLYLIARASASIKTKAKEYIMAIIGPITSSGGVSSYNDLTDVPTQFPPEAHTHVEADITDLGSYIGEAPIDGTPYVRQDAGWTAAATGGYTNEQAQDAIGTILLDTATIDFTYDDATPNISADVKAASITEAMQVLADNTTNDVSIAKHGYVPKAPNDTAKFLRGDATWAALVYPIMISVIQDSAVVLGSSSITTSITMS